MAYKVIILYQLYMPSYFLGTFTEYPFLRIQKENPSRISPLIPRSFDLLMHLHNASILIVF